MIVRNAVVLRRSCDESGSRWRLTLNVVGRELNGEFDSGVGQDVADALGLDRQVDGSWSADLVWAPIDPEPGADG